MKFAKGAQFSGRVQAGQRATCQLVAAARRSQARRGAHPTQNAGVHPRPRLRPAHDRLAARVRMQGVERAPRLPRDFTLKVFSPGTEMGGPAAGLLLAGLAVLASPARALLVSPARLPAIRPASGAACGLRMAADHEEPDGASTEETERGSRKKGILWNRVRNRVREDDLKRAPIGESVEVITKEIDQVLADRRKRLNTQLKTSLTRFRTEVVSEVALQANETKERQARLRERRGLIITSLSGLREDILDEIEAT